MPSGGRRPRQPVTLAPGVPRPPLGTLAVEVMPFEIQVGDWLPFSDQVARRILDLRAVGPGHWYRRVAFGDLPALTVRRRVRVYRDLTRLIRPRRLAPAQGGRTRSRPLPPPPRNFP